MKRLGPLPTQERDCTQLCPCQDSWSHPLWQMHGIATFPPPITHPSPASDHRTHLGIRRRGSAPADSLLMDSALTARQAWVDHHQPPPHPCKGPNRAQQPRTPLQELSLQVQRAAGVFKAFLAFNSTNVYSAPFMCQALLWRHSSEKKRSVPSRTLHFCGETGYQQGT